MAAGISDRDAQAEGHVVLRAGGDDPQGGARAGQGFGHGKNRAIAAADHEHADPLREGVPDHPDRSQPGSTRKASGTSFQACISWITSTISMGDPLAAPALGLKISLAFMRRLFVERGFSSWIPFIRLHPLAQNSSAAPAIFAGRVS